MTCFDEIVLFGYFTYHSSTYKLIQFFFTRAFIKSRLMCYGSLAADTWMPRRGCRQLGLEPATRDANANGSASPYLAYLSRYVALVLLVVVFIS